MVRRIRLTSAPRASGQATRIIDGCDSHNPGPIPAGAGPALVHRSAGFGSPQLVIPLADTGAFGDSLHYKEFPAHFYFKLTPAGTSVQQLYRYDRPGNGLSHGDLTGPGFAPARQLRRDPGEGHGDRSRRCDGG